MKELQISNKDTTKAFETIIKTNNVRKLDQRQRKSLFLALEQVASALNSSDDKKLFDRLRVLGQQIVVLYPGASADHYSAIIQALNDNATEKEKRVLARIEKRLENPVAQDRLACLQIAIGDAQSDPDIAGVLSEQPIVMRKLEPQKMGVIFFNAFGKGDNKKIVEAEKELVILESKAKEGSGSPLAAEELKAKKLALEKLEDARREAVFAKQESLRASKSYENNTKLYYLLATTTNSNEDDVLRASDRARNELVLKANLKILKNKLAKLQQLISQISLKEEDAVLLIEQVNIAQQILQDESGLSEQKNNAVMAQIEGLDEAIQRLKIEVKEKRKGLIDHLIQKGYSLPQEGVNDAGKIAENDLLFEQVISFVDNEDKNLLHHAVLSGDMVLVELLIQNKVSGVDVITHDNAGKTPLDYAVASDNLEMVDCLLNILPADCQYCRSEFKETLQKVKEKFSSSEVTQHLGQPFESIDSQIQGQNLPPSAASAAYIAINSQLKTLLDANASTHDSERLTTHVKKRYGVLSTLLDTVSSVISNIFQFIRENCGSSSKPKEESSAGLSCSLLKAAAASSAPQEGFCALKLSSVIALDSPIFRGHSQPESSTVDSAPTNIPGIA
ncbi:MAG: ankyrin repeat domain-containing protein [Gammaproteobacteria bacterium]|nr:ankyrin repeat domain-containing protein [Gammaproteobacteria bacterium]